MAGKSTISITFKLDGDGKGFKALAQDADGLKQVMAGTIVEAQKLNKSMLDWSLSVQAIGAVSNAVGQLNSTFQSITGESNQFTKAMRQANTMAGKDAAGFKDLKGQVADLAKQIPIARDELANGLYMVISNGVPEDNWISFLEASAKAAIGGIADLQQAVTVTSTIIKNYGLAWEEAGAIQDKIQLTAKYGVTSFEQLAEALPSVAGSAAQLGVSIEELLAVFATATGVTGNTAEVSTQLGAVLKALIKPSTEAAKAAEAMGIQFDSAGIRAAGGLDNFLKELDVTIKQYAAETGELSETIYGNLFGSSRALRLLTSLTGEQADKFTENIAKMSDSAGTIDAAFEEMSSTGEAAAQKLKNQFAGITDVVAGLGKTAAPIMAFSANVLVSVNSVAMLTKTVKQLNIAQAAATLRNKAGAASMLLFGLNTNKAAAVQRVFNSALRGGAYSATALKIALRGLMIASGVGIAIAAVTAAVEAFTRKSGEATEATNILEDAEDAFKSKFGEVKTALDGEIKKLAELIKAKADTTEAVAHLNQEYGAIFGTHKTAAEWYDTLTTKSKDYATQLAFEAKASSLRTRMAENDAARLANAEKMRRMAEAGEDTKQVYQAQGTSITGASFGGMVTVVNPEYKALQDANTALEAENEKLQAELDVTDSAAKKFADSLSGAGDAAADATKQVSIAAMNLQQVKTKLEANEKKGLTLTDPKDLAALKAENQQLQARKKALEAAQGLDKGGSSRVAVADPSTLQELSTNIDIYKKKLTGADTEEQRAIQAQIAAWTRKKEAIELAQKAAEVPGEITTLQDVSKALEVLRTKRNAATNEEIANIDEQIAAMELLQAQIERPVSLDSLQAIDKEINYQRKLRASANKDALAGIDAEINRLQTLRNYVEHADVIDTPDEALQTYEQLNIKLSYYNDLLKTATTGSRGEIQAHIDKLEEIKKAWDDALAAAKKPADISQLNSIEKLDEAIAYYNAQQKKAGADEVQTIQTTIQALEAKRKALQMGVEIPSMQKEIAEINALTGREYKLKIQGIGFDGLTDKIRELRKQLNDLDNPVTEKQRADIEAIIGTYEDWRRQVANSFETYREGWNGIKGIGDGIQSITDALEGNGSTWQKVTAIVDGFLQLYDGIKTVIGIIEMLSAASSAHAVVKGVEAGAETTEATTRATAAATGAAASAATIAANKLETASWAELAAAMTFAAHAEIPFAGPAIAASFIAMQQSMIIAAGIPKYAKGALAYGPTLGVFGEYAGAANNPEVVAPLDKLRTYLQPSDGLGGNVRFTIEGRNLVGVLEKETNVKRRS